MGLFSSKDTPQYDLSEELYWFFYYIDIPDKEARRYANIIKNESIENENYMLTKKTST